MIWLIIWVCIIVFAFEAFFLDKYMRPETIGGYFFTGLFYLFCAAFSGFVCALAGVGIGQAFTSFPVEGAHQKLATIRDKDGVEGRFFLGSGFVNSRPYYFYYESMADGALRPGKLNADGGVRVYQENRQDAELVTFDWHITYPWWAILVCIPEQNGTGKSYDFHVPKGTVKAGYSM